MVLYRPNMMFLIHYFVLICGCLLYPRKKGCMVIAELNKRSRWLDIDQVLFCIYFVKCDAITSISSHLDWTSLAVSEGWCQAGKVTPSCPQLGNRICSNGAAAAIQPGFKTPSFVGINKECRMVWHGLFLINMFFVWQVMTTDFLRVAQFLNSE